MSEIQFGFGKYIAHKLIDSQYPNKKLSRRDFLKIGFTAAAAAVLAGCAYDENGNLIPPIRVAREGTPSAGWIIMFAKSEDPQVKPTETPMPVKPTQVGNTEKQQLTADVKKINEIIFNPQDRNFEFDPSDEKGFPQQLEFFPDSVKKYWDLIVKNAKYYNIDARILATIMLLESGGDKNANLYNNKSKLDRAMGLMQVMPQTAQTLIENKPDNFWYLDKKFLSSPKQNIDSYYDPAVNIELATRYFAIVRQKVFIISDKKGVGLTEAEADSVFQRVVGAINKRHKLSLDPKKISNKLQIMAAGSYNAGVGPFLPNSKTEIPNQTVDYMIWFMGMYANPQGARATYDYWLKQGGQKLVDAAK